MILGCSNAEDFLEMAEEGARIAQLGYDACDNPGDLEEQLVKDCNAVYEQAKKDYEELEDEEEGEDVKDANEGDNSKYIPPRSSAERGSLRSSYQTQQFDLSFCCGVALHETVADPYILDYQMLRPPLSQPQAHRAKRLSWRHLRNLKPKRKQRE